MYPAFEHHWKQGVEYLTIPAFEATGKVCHGFSTRRGGVSTGEFTSMNLGPSRGDNLENVRQNYQRFCGAIGVDWTKTVFSAQVHHDVIYTVTKEDAGKGIFRPRELTDADGLITKEKGIPLVTFYADCVPLIFLDPVQEVIACVHSGWRGTVQKIGTKAIRKMVEEFGCRRQDILAAVGPCIGPCHYEVDEACAQEFYKAFGEDGQRIVQPGQKPGKYMVDLRLANTVQFLAEGILPEHITVANECTQCEPERYYSHRVMGDRRGNLAMIIALKEE